MRRRYGYVVVLVLLVMLPAAWLAGLLPGRDAAPRAPESAPSLELGTRAVSTEDGAPGALLAAASAEPAPPELQPMPSGWRTSVLPLASGSIEEATDVEPYELGYQARALASPDGSLLAVTAFRAAEVELFDLVDWVNAGVIEVEAGVTPVAWSEDGARIYASRDYCEEPAAKGRCPGGWHRELWELDVEALSARRLADIDLDAGQWHFAGGVAAVLAVRTEICCGIDPEGEPIVLALDLDSGQVLGEVEIPGLLMGQPRHWLGDTSRYASYRPGTALSPDGSRFYVVDSVDHIVTVVDLKSMSVAATHDLGEPRSHFARALDWLQSRVVSTAQAKGGPSYSRQAALTADGRYLVTSGTVAMPDGEGEGDEDYKHRPAGLLIIDTATMKVVYREETASSFVLSPDARRLLATGYYWDDDLADESGMGGEVAFGVQVIDMITLKETAHLLDGEHARVAAISPDGRYAYVTVSHLDSRRPGTPCSTACFWLSLVELDTGMILDERRLNTNESVMPARN